ncbi:PIN domain-containing protein [Nocardioides plantarum]|uniref:PIN domain-containing protein n=1 Tax=Nocardioides plantarum TaxID=29299 RepID=A0ABV5K5H3_9ACTN|nr:PIN domain-containing protein [Nocardioides plantarum]
MTLRLLPGSQPRYAAEELGRQETAVGNVRTGGYLGQDLLKEYLKWALGAERMLLNHFTRDSVSAVVFTQRYWALQTSSSDNWEMSRLLVEAEIIEQSARLLAEKALLDDAHTRWTRGRLLVPDTSALIHGPKLWEWDPAADLGWRDVPVHIVLPMLVLDELDELKEHTKEHTRYRARQTLKWVAEQIGSSQSFLVGGGSVAEGPDGLVVRGDIHLDVLLDAPGHVRLPIADDEIVDRAAAIATLSGRDVVLVTNDVSQAYRGRLAGLDVSTVAEPIYDVDIQEQAKAGAKAERAQKAADRRVAQEAQRGKRKGGQHDQSESQTPSVPVNQDE